jgi:hypothetical protein
MPPEEEEDIPGYVWRNSMTSGRRRMKGQVQALVGRQALEPPWIVPSNLETLAANLSSVFSGANEILRNHTCLPAFLPFARPESLPQILGHVLCGESHRGVPSMLGLAGRYIMSKPTLAMCIECVREDEERLGFAYWRRFHNLPGLTYCLKHRQPLVHGCGKCAYSGPKARTPRLPRERCWCGQPHVRLPAPKMPRDRAMLMTLSRMAHELLGGALSGRTPAQIGAYYAICARTAGFQDGSRLRSPAIAREFQERYSPELLQHLNASLGSARRNWLEVALGRREAPLCLTRNLLLFDFFGARVPTADDFERAAASYAEASAAAKRQKAPAAFDVQTARQTVERYLRENPQAGREQLLRALGRTAANLRTLDSEWYEQRLASKRGQDPLTAEMREAYSAEFDVRTAQHVRRKRESLLDVIGKPKRMTRRVLLEGCPRGNEVTTEREKLMPLTSTALRDCVESSDAYKERYAVYVLQTTPADMDRHREAKRRTGLPTERILKLVAKLILKDVA